MLAEDVLREVVQWEGGAVGVGTGEPERGSGCRVRVGVESLECVQAVREW